MASSGWETVGAISPKELVRARLELHHAAQIASAAGATLLEAREDSSQTNLGWESGALSGHSLDASSGKRAGVRFADLALVVLDAGGRTIAEHGLAGSTLDEGTAWLARALGVGTLSRPDHPLPPHPLAHGAAFAGDDAPARVELARWLGSANAALSAIAREHGTASAVRCWPHHFDIATLIALEGVRTIGVGLSLGDSSYAEPYFYVTPWPYPKRGTTLPSLPFGHWHVEGWTGAVLEGSILARAKDQERAASDMLHAAVQGCLALHGE